MTHLGKLVIRYFKEFSFCKSIDNFECLTFALQIFMKFNICPFEKVIVHKNKRGMLMFGWATGFKSVMHLKKRVIKVGGGEFHSISL